MAFSVLHRSAIHPLALFKTWGRYVAALLLMGLTALLPTFSFASEPNRRTAPVLDVGIATNDAFPVDLSQYLAVWEDPGKKMGLSDAAGEYGEAKFSAQATPDKAVNLGLTQSAVWVRLKIQNSSGHALERMLEISYPRLELLDFYVVAPGRATLVVNTGFARPFANRAHAHRMFVLPLKIEAGGTATVYARIESLTPVEFPAAMWSPSAFWAYERSDYMAQAAFFGLVAGSFLFNALLWISLRNRSYIVYLLFVASTTLTIAASTGLGVEYLWTDATAWTVVSVAVTGLLGSTFFVAFMRELLGTAKLFPRYDRVLLGSMALSAVCAAFMLVNFQPKLAMIWMVLVMLLSMPVVCIQAVRGQRTAIIFLTAFAVFLIGIVLNVLRLVGLLDTNFLTQHGIQIGAAIESVVLAFALADRFHLEREEKERAQYSALVAERQLVDTLRASESMLEVRIQQRTNELSAALQNLRKTQVELIEAEKLASLGALVAGVAHELNTPIGNALTTASTIEEEAKSLKRQLGEGSLKRSLLDLFIERNLEMSFLVVRSCERAAALISSFKRVAVDQTSEQRRVFNLAEVVEDNLRALRPSYKAANWVFENHVDKKLQCDSYPGPMGQVLTNLIQNAVLHAFLGRDHGTVTIGAELIGSTIELIVKDDGVGMSEATLHHIFEPFFTTALGKGGSGLGLSVSRNLVMGVMGGSIRAESTLHAGTQIYLRLPLVAPNLVQQMLATPAHADAREKT